VLFILADDLGYTDTSLYGSKLYETPNIDALAQRGMVFTNAYAANPLCSPTRASIMTGLWPARVGITTPGCHAPEPILESALNAEAPADEKALAARSATRLKTEYYTLASAFRAAGYATAHIGKWHLGPEPYSPLEHGFDVDIPHTPAPSPLPDGWFAPWPVWPGQGEPGEHLEDRMAQEAAGYIKEHGSEPFYMSLWLFSVHSPWHAKQHLIDKYARKVDPKDPQHNPVYAAMVESMDDAVGTVVTALEDAGVADNTIIVFFSDNGGVHWGVDQHVHPDYVGVPITSAAPMRGGKATIYEGGTREPLIVVWPGQVGHGTRNDQAIVQSIDFFPTLAGMCELDTRPAEPFDGVSFLPALRGETFDRGPIFCHFPHYTKATGQRPAAYVRRGDWKLIRFFCDSEDQTDRLELYNLAEDIGETTDLTDEHAGVATELNVLLGEFLDESGAVVPQPNPRYQADAPASGQ